MATMKLYPVADNYTYKPTPTTNNGSFPALVICSDGTYTAYTYIKFNIGSYKKITAATLSIYTYTVEASASATIYSNNNDWTEGGLTWNNQPTAGSSYGTINSSSGWTTSTDLINLVTLWKTTNYGLQIRFSSGNTNYFYSRTGTYPPYLTITYVPSDGIAIGSPMIF